MRKIKSTTVEGKRVVAIGQRYEGEFLHQVYGKWSRSKQLAYDRCYNEYCETDGATDFSICSHNSFGFTCSWFTPDGMRVETPKNSYLVIFE